MKRRILIALYALLPIAGAAYHYGPGQRGVALDHVQSAMAKAKAAELAENFSEARQAYDEALAAAPESEADLKAKIQVLKADARMLDGEVPEALGDLESALAVARTDGASKEVINQLIAQKSSAHYYAAWLVRLENVSEEEWKNQCDQARQGFRYLAEDASKCGETDSQAGHQQSLESSIRLAQMDVSELKALPLPKR